MEDGLGLKYLGEKGFRIAIPLLTTKEPSGTLRLILKEGKVEVHYTIVLEKTKNCGRKTLGIDKGYTEVFVDSEGSHYGEGGDLLIALDGTHYHNSKHIHCENCNITNLNMEPLPILIKE